jgi:hypothetical protein
MRVGGRIPAQLNLDLAMRKAHPMPPEIDPKVDIGILTRGGTQKREAVWQCGLDRGESSLDGEPLAVDVAVSESSGLKEKNGGAP